MKTIRLAFLIFLTLLVTIPVRAGETVSILGGASKGWDGWTSDSKAWGRTDMPRADNPAPTVQHVESLAVGESQTGAFRSPNFTVSADFIRFQANGWDGEHGGKGVSGYFLKLAKDGSVLRHALPPMNDGFLERTWIVGDLRGKEVYFEAVDGDSGSAFAWLGLAKVEECTMQPSADGRRYYSIPLAGYGTWAIMRRDGGNRTTPDYLSSLGGGEAGVGTIRSPEFTISAPTVRLTIRGWDGRDGERKSISFELVAVDTGDVLRSCRPPLTDSPTPVEWDVADLTGRRVCLRLTDSNSDTSFAWMGIDEVDAGDAFRVKFAEKPSLAGWKAEVPDPGYVERGGIPFLSAPWSAIGKGSPICVDAGLKAKHIFLLGMTNSADKGCPVWGDPRDTDDRFFIGDQLGRVYVEYADGKTQDFPLTLGESLWWGRKFYEAPEPFASDPQARKALADSLRLYPASPVQDGRYMAVITPRPAAIRSITVEDTTQKHASPAVVAMTIEPEPGQNLQDWTELPHGDLPPDAALFIAHKSLRQSGIGEQAAEKALDTLRKHMYGTPELFAGHIALDIPQGYRGPRVSFEGNAYAEVLANIYHHNLQDIASKVDAEGMYHTSSKDAPSWGGYEGFGTFSKKTGSYYGHSWSRDLGRSLGELTINGYTSEALRCADYCLRDARLYEERKDISLDGHPLPRHWCRIINLPGTTPGQGCFENDGHALISLFIYKLWQRLPNRDEWLKARWPDIKGAGDWILWQFEHPEISGATDVLRTDSECAGGTGYSIYADFGCMEALRSLAEMADSIGEKDSASRWRTRADLMQKAIPKAYAIADPKYGRAWTLTSSGWPNQSTVMGPAIISADTRGFEPDASDWRGINEATYKRLTDSYKPLGFYGTAMGYGQGFVTQSALLMDKMKDATTMLEWAARCTYDPRYKPYIVPEGCEIGPGGKFWFRTGDLGNGVQEAEIVKAIRIVLGADDTHPAQPRLSPRMPWGWTDMKVARFPMLVQRGGHTERAMVGYTLRRQGAGMSLELSSDRTLSGLQIRLGPFAKAPSANHVRLDGGHWAGASVAKSGDAYWVTVPVAGPVSKCSVVVK